MNKLPDGWQELPLSECVNKISIKYKIKQKYYLKNGKYPIIDQGQNFISGYSNNEIAINIKKPVIVFGDHTRCFKYVDFNFIAGADGIKILEPKEFFNEKLFYYFCLILDFPNKGYSRHYQYLAKTIIRIPPLEVQKEISSRLDFSFDKIDKALELLLQNKEHIKKYRLSLLKYAFDGKLTPSSKNWETKTLGEVCEFVYGKSLDKKKRKENGKYPVYAANGIKDYSDEFMLKENSIIIGRKGSVGSLVLTYSPCWVLDVSYYINFNKLKYDLIFLFYLLKFLNLKQYARGVKPGLSRSQVYELKVRIPLLEVQKEIVSILEERFEVMEKVENLNNENIKNLSLLKKSMLKQAFSGEIRL